MSDSNGDLESDLVGIVLASGATYFFAVGMIPWQPWLGCTFVALYLMLPKRMQRIAESIKSFIKNGKK